MQGNLILPRLIRLRDAPHYLGMDRHRFNETVRPTLTEVPIGSQGIAFDRFDLDAWVDDYIQSCGRSAEMKLRSLEKWGESESLGYKNVMGSGSLTKKSTDVDFMKALALATSKKPKDILRKSLKK